HTAPLLQEVQQAVLIDLAGGAQSSVELRLGRGQVGDGLREVCCQQVVLLYGEVHLFLRKGVRGAVEALQGAAVEGALQSHVGESGLQLSSGLADAGAVAVLESSDQIVKALEDVGAGGVEDGA